MPDSTPPATTHEAAVFQLGQLTAMAQAAQDRHAEITALLERADRDRRDLQDDVTLIRTGELMQIRANLTAGLADAAAETSALRAWLKEVNGRAHATNDELAELSRLTINRRHLERAEASNSSYRKRIPWLILVGIAITASAWILQNLPHIAFH